MIRQIFEIRKILTIPMHFSLLEYIVVYPEWFVSDSGPTFQVIADPDTDPDFT